MWKVKYVKYSKNVLNYKTTHEANFGDSASYRLHTAMKKQHGRSDRDSVCNQNCLKGMAFAE